MFLDPYPLTSLSSAPQTIEAAYILVQECLLEGLSVLKEECRTAACQQEVLIRSDMDLILHSRTYLEGKLRGDYLLTLERESIPNPSLYYNHILGSI